MSHHDLNAIATQLPDAWRSTLLARIGETHLKVTRMDGSPYEEEVHAYAEGLLVIDGQLNLIVAGQPKAVCRGELYIVPAGVPHAVAAGSTGTLVILDV